MRHRATAHRARVRGLQCQVERGRESACGKQPRRPIGTRREPAGIEPRINACVRAGHATHRNGQRSGAFVHVERTIETEQRDQRGAFCRAQVSIEPKFRQRQRPDVSRSICAELHA